MLQNRSIPHATVIPVLAYPDAPEAAAWLCQVFGFTVRLRIDTHRVQLNVGDGAVIVREPRPYEKDAPLGLGHNLTVRIGPEQGEADAHCTHARQNGAHILQEPTTQPYGERQYVAEDPAGHQWTFLPIRSRPTPGSLGRHSGTSVNGQLALIGLPPEGMPHPACVHLPHAPLH